MPYQTVVALYDDATSAQQVLSELRTAGFSNDDFWVSGSSGAGSSRFTEFARDFSSSGGRVTALQRLGVPESDAHVYAEGVRRGGTLLVGEIPDEQTDRALGVIERYAPVNMEERGQNYRTSGWSRYDETGQDYTSDQILQERSRYGSDTASGFRSGSGATSDNYRGATTENYIGENPSIGQPLPATNLGAPTGRTDTRGTDVSSSEYRETETNRGIGTDQTSAGNLGNLPPVTGTNNTTGTTGGSLFGSDQTTGSYSETSRVGTNQSTATGSVGTGQEQAIPIVEEQIAVGKRAVQGGSVRVRTYLRETPVEEQVTLRQETVHVERRRVDQPVSGIPADALQDRTIEVTSSNEEAVVSKTARIVEEVVISKDVQERTETVRDTVRRTEVEVDDTTNTNQSGMANLRTDTTTGTTNGTTTGRDDRSLAQKAKDALTPGNQDPNRRT